MAWPSANVSLANVSAASDRISSARADIEDAFTKLNEIITEGPAIEAVAVSGQDTVVYAGSNGTLTLVAGDNITLATNNTAKSVTITSAGGELVNDTTPQLGGDLDVNNWQIKNTAGSYVGINDPVRAYAISTHPSGDSSFASNSAAISMVTSNTAQITTNNYSLNNPSGVRFDIYSDGFRFNTWSGPAEIDYLALPSQPTGTPTNTTTPTGWIQISINGTTRYMPYYT